MKIPTTLPSILDVCEQLGLKLEEAGDELRCVCPNPKHDDHEPSCYINPQKELWYCHGCGEGGNAADLYAMVKGCSKQKAINVVRRMGDKPQPFPPLKALDEEGPDEAAHMFVAIMKRLGQSGRTPPAALLSLLYREDPTEKLRRYVHDVNT